jgi:exoribonuclease R
MIRFNDLPGYYELDEANYQVIERRTGKRYRLGDKLFVKVKKTDMVKRTVDLIPVN